MPINHILIIVMIKQGGSRRHPRNECTHRKMDSPALSDSYSISKFKGTECRMNTDMIYTIWSGNR